MEVTFDNKSDVLSAKLHTTLDAVIYTLETTYVFCPSSGTSTIGAINRREKTIEVNDVRKKVGDLKKR
ncbi:hypothetical protein AAF712_011066 [Marasmius tenuissimus]|uniref:Uncharacterized protein n=1 Tax=Marasmius tenuissimus TaxID=585030 RepID=A0ABR2ZKG8_9AGAR|nr:hypothetical protein PM082_023854 [Marasmius tenuissimus]